MAEHPSEDDVKRFHRWFAVECNNAAWALAECDTRSPADDAHMLDAAHAAAFHWRVVGTEINAVRAQSLLGLVHAMVGSKTLARRYADASLDYFLRNPPDPWELALAHAIASLAAATSGDRARHREQYELARAASERIVDPEEKSIFLATFGRVPVPAS